ncbi:MAG: diacylglycerol kinase [Micromonosporaceae bacterium]
MSHAGEVVVMVNPTAGRGRHRELVQEVLAALRTSGTDIRVLEAGSVAEASAACQAAVAGGADALVAVGGDGTVHVAVQAVAGTSVPFGVVPAGTGNDFASEVGVPAQPVAAARAVAEALRTGRTRPIDLARLTGPGGYQRWFAAVLGAGFDAIVNERANAMRWPKGRRRYDLAIFAELLRLRPRRYRIVLDGEPLEVDAVLVAVGNTACYGGGMRMCPQADATDGTLDIVVAGPISRTTLLRLQPRVYKGTHVTHPMVTTYRARTVEIAADSITSYVDGERACSLPVTVTAMPAALTLLSA